MHWNPTACEQENLFCWKWVIHKYDNPTVLIFFFMKFGQGAATTICWALILSQHLQLYYVRCQFLSYHVWTITQKLWTTGKYSQIKHNADYFNNASSAVCLCFLFTAPTKFHNHCRMLTIISSHRWVPECKDMNLCSKSFLNQGPRWLQCDTTACNPVYMKRTKTDNLKKKNQN